MAELLESNGLRVFAYLTVGAVSVAARFREKRRAADVVGVWSPFWSLTAGLFIAMAIGRLGDVGDLLAEVGRDRAVERGWYASRRPFQAAIVIGVATTWFVLVAWAVWRLPERRRRYLPMSVLVITLVGYAAIRVVSLHQVDAVLYHQEILTVRWGSVLELALLAIAAGTTIWIPSPRDSGAPISRYQLGDVTSTR